MTSSNVNEWIQFRTPFSRNNKNVVTKEKETPSIGICFDTFTRKIDSAIQCPNEIGERKLNDRNEVW
jgi:hypothetical protein